MNMTHLKIDEEESKQNNCDINIYNMDNSRDTLTLDYNNSHILKDFMKEEMEMSDGVCVQFEDVQPVMLSRFYN